MDKLTKTARVNAGTRIYYIDAYESKNGSGYISIAEIPTRRSPRGAKRQRIFLHPEDIEKFRQALEEVASSIIGGEARE